MSKLQVAIDSARLLAVKKGEPVIVMGNCGDFSVSLQTDQRGSVIAVHYATVYPSGAVDRECLKTRWLRFRSGKCACE